MSPAVREQATKERCIGKRRFTHEGAHKTVDKAAAEGIHFQAYECVHCGHWHLDVRKRRGDKV